MMETSTCKFSISFSMPHKLSQNCNNNKINYVDSRHRAHNRPETETKSTTKLYTPKNFRFSSSNFNGAFF